MSIVKKPFIQSKNHLAKTITQDGFYFQHNLDIINHVLRDKHKMYGNFSRLCDDEKGKYFRVMYEPLNSLNRKINEQVLKKYDNEIPVYIHGGISKKSNIGAAYVHSKFKYNRSYIILDFSNYFEQISFNDIVNSLQVLGIANEKSAKIIAELGCVPKGKKIQKDGEKVVARGFCTSSRLAIYGSLKFFKNLKRLLNKELNGLNSRISIFVDDITISFDNINVEKVDILKEKIYLLANEEGFIFNQSKTKILINVKNIDILGVLVKRGNIDVTRDFEKGISEGYQNIANTNGEEKEKARRIVNGKLGYKRQVRGYGKM